MVEHIRTSTAQLARSLLIFHNEHQWTPSSDRPTADAHEIAAKSVSIPPLSIQMRIPETALLTHQLYQPAEPSTASQAQVVGCP